MEKTEIYGIGAALVDIEAKVSETFLEDHEIQKGIMTIVSADVQSTLISDLVARDVDLTFNCGGSICNSLVLASALGTNCVFNGKVGTDQLGQKFKSDLVDAGVEFQGSTFNGKTGTCLVMVTDDADRTMNTSLGEAEDSSELEIDDSKIANSNWFFVEGYQLLDVSNIQTIKRAISSAKKKGLKVAMSLSDPNVVRENRDAFLSVLGDRIDLIFCNEQEAIAFSEKTDVTSSFDVLGRYSRAFIVTLGSNGSIGFDGVDYIKIKGEVKEVIDTTGAGDAFAGAFLHSIIVGKEFREASKIANYCASEVVEVFGPRLLLSAVKKIKDKFHI